MFGSSVPSIVINLTYHTGYVLHLTAEYFKISQCIMLNLKYNSLSLLSISITFFSIGIFLRQISPGAENGKRVSAMRARGNIPTSERAKSGFAFVVSLRSSNDNNFTSDSNGYLVYCPGRGRICKTISVLSWDDQRMGP